MPMHKIGHRVPRVVRRKVVYEVGGEGHAPPRRARPGSPRIAFARFRRRKGDPDDRSRECTTRQPGGGRGAAVPHVGVLRPEGVRGQGAPVRREPADVGGGRHRLRGGARRAQRVARQQPQRVQEAHPEEPRGRPGAGGPQAQEGHLLPRVDTVALVARRRLAGRPGRRGLRQRGLDPRHGPAGAVAGGRQPLQLGGLQAGLGAGRPGGGAAHARPGGPALLLPVGGRHLREVPRGGPLGLPGRGQRHRAWRGRPQAPGGAGLRGHRVLRGMEGVPGGPEGEGARRGW